MGARSGGGRAYPEDVRHSRAGARGSGEVPGLCAHADADEILAWLRDAPAPNATHLVHGEPEGARVLRDRLAAERGRTEVLPRPGERVLIR
ncbi:MBL fold metallo-hydrolase RNA specificity domain-containing protein [Embleya sp. MST-111070]|uniref:MBL fold metallo-hydrolase RNA specificity domain-containing protein n=1 Tax=Embleya sp. MST-111070 TaxID=3398231 RepID=UPI003F7407ED